MTTTKEDFGTLCYNSASADNLTKQNIINKVFAKLPMFYRNKQGHFYQIFNTDQVTHAFGTLEDSNQFPAHDPYPGSSIIYYCVNIFLIVYKDLPYNGQICGKLTTKFPSNPVLTTKKNYNKH